MKNLLLAALLTFSFQGIASAQFVGEVVLTPAGCKETEFCILGKDFGFIDQYGVGWQADKGDVTDGASIPKWAQKFIGVPYTPEYIKAAVIHDHYSKSVRPVRGWYQTQEMFYEALLKSGVPKKRAAIMFAGVLIGSGKWIVRMEGKPCSIGETCVNTTATVTLEREAESYGSDSYKTSFKKLSDQLNAMDELDTNNVLKLAREERPNSVYLKNLSGEIRINMDQFPNNTQDR